MKHIINTLTRDSKGLRHLSSGAVKTALHVNPYNDRFYAPSMYRDYNGYAYDGHFYMSGKKILDQRASWIDEGESYSRGAFQRMPQKIIAIATEGEILIVNADSYNVWMKFFSPGVIGNRSAEIFKSAYVTWPHHVPITGSEPTFATGWDSKVWLTFSNGILACLYQVSSIEPTAAEGYADNYLKHLTLMNFRDDKVFIHFAGSDYYNMAQSVIQPCQSISSRNHADTNSPIIKTVSAATVEQFVWEEEDKWPAAGRSVNDVIDYIYDGQYFYIILSDHGITVLRDFKKIYHLPTEVRLKKGFVNPDSNILYLAAQDGDGIKVLRWPLWYKAPQGIRTPFTAHTISPTPYRSLLVNDIVGLGSTIYVATNVGLFEVDAALTSHVFKLASTKVAAGGGPVPIAELADAPFSFRRLAVDPDTGLLGVLTSQYFYEVNAITGQVIRKTNTGPPSVFSSKLTSIQGVPS